MKNILSIKTVLIFKLSIAWFLYFIAWIVCIYTNFLPGGTILSLFLLAMVSFTGIIIGDYKDKKIKQV